MSKPSGADLPRLLQWTRTGLVQGSWGPYETFESLVFPQTLQGYLQKLALGFLGSQDFCVKARLPWRRGAFLFGPAGCGKSAATRAIALLLSWPHVTIPAHEILDTNHLTRALLEVAKLGNGVVVLDNVDQVFQRIDAGVFFDIYDMACDQADGIFWVATTRKAEDVPKNQLIRPGRFEESVRIAPPAAEVKRKYYEQHLQPFMEAALGGQAEALNAAKQEHLASLESNDALTFAHLQEMRLLIAKVLMDGDPERLISEFQSFCQEQVISGDRWGGPSSEAVELEERIKLSDPRLLLSALHVTDAFKKIVEATVTNAAEALTAAQAESGS